MSARRVLVAAAACLLGASLAARADDEKIKVGVYLPLTGGSATFGDLVARGIKLAVAERNAKGGVSGKKIELVLRDDQDDDAAVKKCVERLVTEDQVVALIGEVTSTRSILGARVAQKRGVPMLAPVGTNMKVTKVGDRIFRACFTDDFQGFLVAKFAVANLKAKKAAILHDDAEDYSASLGKRFKRAFEKLDGEICSDQTYSAGATDFEEQLTAIRDAQPDVVFIPGQCADVANIAIQARKLKIKCPLLGEDGWDSPRLIELAGSAIEDCYFCNHFCDREKRDAVKDFVGIYKEKHGERPDALAALGYDAARLLFDAMDRAKSLDGEELAKALAATKDFAGVTGSITIDADRNARKSGVIVKIEDGKFRHAATIAPEDQPEGK